ncbi:MAG: aminopeptidase [Gemmatimonadales bacterium]
MTVQPKKRRLTMGLLIAAAALLVGYGTAYIASDDVRYLSRAGIEETRILLRRVPIDRLVADSSVPPVTRQRARLVLAVRAFAATLGLNARQTYTTYSDVGRDTLLLVLTASPRNCICPVTWHYPIAGRVPYKGFFNFAQAGRAAADYAARGYDINLRPSDAFSTLGWFNDPLLSTALAADSVELAALVFHEIAHNTLWVKGATDFNESFAQWVGYRAAAEFFLSRQDTAAATRASGRWHDEQLLGEYYSLLVHKLDSLYALHLAPAANDSGRTTISRWSRDTLEFGFGPFLRTYSIGSPIARPINNAALIGVRLYRTNLDLFDEWDRANNHDLALGVYKLHQLLDGADGSDAFRLMRAMLGQK